MRILLHTCCAPCLIYPLERMRGQGFEVEAFFYNPNIHPLAEYLHRRQAVEKFAEDSNLAAVYPEYRPQEFFQEINQMEERLERCPICWFERLKRTAQHAKQNSFDCFSTTLLVSPYQDQEALNSIGNDIARDQGIKFYYEDFRPGFRQAHNRAKSEGMYCQKYCGCIYSEIERCKKSVKL